MTRRYSIHELAQATGVPRRTIRYYVQRGLIPAPEGAGRGHFYTDAHLERLQRVRALQEQGRPLDEIAVLLEAEDRDSPVVYAAALAAPAPRDLRQAAPPEPSAPLPQPVDVEVVTRLRIADGVELSFAAPARVPTPARLRAIVTAVARLLEN